jgi:hypothetical protein
MRRVASEPGVEESVDGAAVVALDRVEEGGAALGVHGRDGGSGAKEGADGDGLALFGGGHEGSFVVVGVGVVAGGEVGGSAGGDELSDADSVAIGGGGHHFVLRGGVVGTGFLEKLDDLLRVGERGYAEQRDLGAVDGVGVGPAAEQEGDGVGAVGADGPDEWSLVHGVAAVDSGAMVEQVSGGVEVAEGDGVGEGRAEVVGRIDAGSGGEEELDGVDVAVEGCSSEKGFAAGVALVGVEALGEEGF